MAGLSSSLSALLPMPGELAGILLLSLFVSGVAILVSMVLGVPAGIFLGLHRFPGRSFLVTIVNTGMGLPPVVVGLAVFLLLARSGPLGGLDLAILVEGGEELRNSYRVIVVNPQKHPKTREKEAKRFAEWLVTPAVQKVIGEFGREKYGQPLFVPDAK